MAELLEVTVDYKTLEKEFEAFDKEMPNTARKLMRAVNNEVKKQVRREAKSRGYKASKTTTYKTVGTVDSGYRVNLKSFADRDYSAKIKMTRNAYYYKFIEYGATVPDRVIHVNGKAITLKGFSYPANPLIYPIADRIWKTNRAKEIMDKKFEEILEKENNKK